MIGTNASLSRHIDDNNPVDAISYFILGTVSVFQGRIIGSSSLWAYTNPFLSSNQIDPNQ